MLQISMQLIAISHQTGAGYHLTRLEDWSEEVALTLAISEGIALSQDHWEAIYFLRGYFQDRGTNSDAQEALFYLEEEFGGSGSRKYLSRLFPGGVIAQGCRIAGLPAFSRAADLASESVH